MLQGENIISKMIMSTHFQDFTGHKIVNGRLASLVQPLNFVPENFNVKNLILSEMFSKRFKLSTVSQVLNVFADSSKDKGSLRDMALVTFRR